MNEDTYRLKLSDNIKRTKVRQSFELSSYWSVSEQGVIIKRAAK